MSGHDLVLIGQSRLLVGQEVTGQSWSQQQIMDLTEVAGRVVAVPRQVVAWETVAGGGEVGGVYLRVGRGQRGEATPTGRS